ncbi:SMR family transporter [Klebsiella pneumoniae subsp. pneumoniae]|nr:SMR family transporter [Klebsiella pneumoniae subsp. pneumoniae]
MTAVWWIHAAWLAIAIMLEIVPTSLKFSTASAARSTASCPWQRCWALQRLSRAVKGIDLSVAYALWGRLRYRGDHRRRLECCLVSV